MWGVHVYLQANFKLDQLASSGRAWIQHEVSDRQGSMLVHPGELANEECMWDKCVNAVFAESTKLDQLAGRGPVR